MQLIVFNSNMAYRKKAEIISALAPDILIVPECENKERLVFSDNVQLPTDFFWYGELPSKGIGIFSYTDYKIKVLKVHNPDFKYVLPLSICNAKCAFTVLAIWTQKPEKHDGYVQHIWNAIHYYDKLLDNENVIIAGDFNSNSIFDKRGRVFNHSNVVKHLEAKNIFSTYHHFFKEEQGAEQQPTLYLQRKIEKPFHLDFSFVSKKLLDKLTNVEVGKFEDWIKYSDHMPVMNRFDL
jgi:exodeoxyribonuclease III